MVVSLVIAAVAVLAVELVYLMVVKLAHSSAAMKGGGSAFGLVVDSVFVEVEMLAALMVSKKAETMAVLKGA